MAKRNFAALLFASIAAVAFSTNVRADQAFTGADGCADLAQLVYSEVTGAAWTSPADHAPPLGDTTRADISICNRTARTVGKAFALAMTSIGSEVYWTYPSGDPGDYCWGGFLDQCYPQRPPLGVEADTWAAVSGTIRHAMPRGPATDQSVFSRSAIRQALRSALSRESRLN